MKKPYIIGFKFGTWRNEVWFSAEDNEEMNKKWKEAVDGLEEVGNSYTNSNEFCMELMEKTGVICTPGSSFGSLGEGYVRFALVRDVPTMERIVRVIDESGILKR